MKTQGSHETTNQKNAAGKVMTEGVRSHEEARKGPDSAAREDARRKEQERINREINPKDPEPSKPPNPDVLGGVEKRAGKEKPKVSEPKLTKPAPPRR